MNKNANTAAIRIAQLRQAMSAMVSSDDRGPSAIAISLQDEIDFLQRQIESDLKGEGQSEETIARPISPNL